MAAPRTSGAAMPVRSHLLDIIRTRLPLLALGAVMTLSAIAAGRHGGRRIWLNLSPSMPIGLYLSRSVGAGPMAFARGTIVAVCLPRRLAAWGRSRGYLTRGRCPDGTAPVGKPVFATRGDTVVVTAAGLARNRAFIPHTQPLAYDRAGRQLPHLPDGTYLVAPDELWLVSTHVAASWDSRYYGPVPAASVIAVLRPLWVAR